MKNKYFVSVFVDGKCAYMFWSADLCEIHVCRLLYKGCEIDVFDVSTMQFVPQSFVSACEKISVDRIKMDMMPQHVICTETKAIYPSLKDCAHDIGSSPATVAESIYNLAGIDGRHYIFESDLEGSKLR